MRCSLFSPKVFCLSNLKWYMYHLRFEILAIEIVAKVSNLKWSSGHLWFSLKDGTSQLNAVLFRREAQALKFELRDGMEVVVTGRLTVYSAYGRYQLVGDQVEPRGQGAAPRGHAAARPDAGQPVRQPPV